eukprot:1713551-Alexandrium_andersonii.AAC.1
MPVRRIEAMNPGPPRMGPGSDPTCVIVCATVTSICTHLDICLQTHGDVYFVQEHASPRDEFKAATAALHP